MKIAFACDHGGFSFRKNIINHLKNLGHEVLDLWPTSLQELDDFPEYSTPVCEAVWKNTVERGILVCGTGIGMSIAANRYKWIRAALLYNSDIAKISRSHNDANIACFGARTMSIESILTSINIFLSEPFIGDKYQRRNEKIDAISC